MLNCVQYHDDEINHIILLPGLFQMAVDHELQYNKKSQNGDFKMLLCTYHGHDAVENFFLVQSESFQPPTHSDNSCTCTHAHTQRHYQFLPC